MFCVFVHESSFHQQSRGLLRLVFKVIYMFLIVAACVSSWTPLRQRVIFCLFSRFVTPVTEFNIESIEKAPRDVMMLTWGGSRPSWTTGLIKSLSRDPVEKLKDSVLLMPSHDGISSLLLWLLVLNGLNLHLVQIGVEGGVEWRAVAYEQKRRSQAGRKTGSFYALVSAVNGKHSNTTSRWEQRPLITDTTAYSVNRAHLIKINCANSKQPRKHWCCAFISRMIRKV